MAKIDAFFKLMFDQGASDLHLVSGQQPIVRLNGEMQRVKYMTLENDELKAMLYEIAPEIKTKQFEETGDVDFGYEIPGMARFRANFFNQKNGCAAVFRQIPSKVLSAEDLGLPPICTQAAMYRKETLRQRILTALLKIRAIPEEAALELLQREHGGFSLNASAFVDADDRTALRRLLSYCTRPANAVNRLHYMRDRERVSYRPIKGKDELLLWMPLEFLGRFAPIIPPPYLNLVRYAGALGPRSKLRGAVCAA
ncbi:MAG: transposase, partial [Elusimicrobia bacterium]|nr:transposase [Elusimicrobiota bacterium]